MITYVRPVRFEEVDAARIAFFARFVTWAHEAMEHLFGELEGGYSKLILERRVGLPAVHVEMNFSRPLRYGDVVNIETTCARLGKRSAVLHYRMIDQASGELAADVRHTVVTTDLESLKSCDMPDDVRATFTRHLEV